MNGSVYVDNWRKLHDAGYFSKHGHYSGWPIDDGSILKELKHYVGIYLDDDVLEIGCGYGRLMISIADHVHSITGVDLHEAPLKRARELLRLKQNATVILNDGMSLPFEDGMFSLVFSSSSFQHMPRSIVRGYFKETARILRSGGRACIQMLAAPAGRTRIDPSLIAEQSVGWTSEQIIAAADGIDMHSRIQTSDGKSLLFIGSVS